MSDGRTQLDYPTIIKAMHNKQNLTEILNKTSVAWLKEQTEQLENLPIFNGCNEVVPLNKSNTELPETVTSFIGNNLP